MTETREAREVIATAHGVTGFDTKTTYSPFPPGGIMVSKNSGSANAYFYPGIYIIIATRKLGRSRKISVSHPHEIFMPRDEI